MCSLQESSVYPAVGLHKSSPDIPESLETSITLGRKISNINPKIKIPTTIHKIVFLFIINNTSF